MIRESLYFTFANRKSTDFGIMNVSILSGLYEEPLMANRSIKEIKVRGKDKLYFVEIEKQPNTLQLSFAFEETWNESLIREVTKWLNVSYYEPLFFSEDVDRVYYVMPVDNINIIHNGLKQGYITLNMRCDSPYAYSHINTTPWIDCSSGSKTIEIINSGDNDFKPEIFIQKIENGDLTITNLSRANSEFIFTGLFDKEEIYVHCDNQIIKTNLVDIWRYDNFNDNYLSIPYGKNQLKIDGKCKVKFQYQYVFNG
jgi:predicted phage tail component-like protein